MKQCPGTYLFSFSRSKPTTDAATRTADTPICLVKLFVFKREAIRHDHRGPVDAAFAAQIATLMSKPVSFLEIETLHSYWA